MDAQEIIDLLNERAEDFCRWLYPAGKKTGAYWELGSLAGEAGASLRVNISGEKVGVWADYASQDTGATLVHLLMRQRGTTNWGKTLCEVKEWLGLPITSTEDRLFREPIRNGGKFETPAKDYAALNPDGPVFRYLTDERKVSAPALARYRVGEHKSSAAMCFVQFSESGKAVTFAKYVACQKTAEGKKREWSDPRGAKPGLWGKHAIDSDNGEVVICEGEIDALSLADLGFDAVSMPCGANNANWVEIDWRWLEQFHSIILCFDQDGAGDEGLKRAYPKLVARLGRHRCRIATLPEGVKDSNDAVQRGRGDELAAAINSAESIDPQPLKSFRDYEERIHDLFFPSESAIPGTPLPWTERLRLRPGEFTLWTGINGHGKSTLLLHCMAHLNQAHGERIILASLESPTHKNGRIVYLQSHGGDIKTEGDFRRVHERVSEGFWVYDFVGNAPWQDVIDTFRYSWRRYGVTQFVIDSLMTCNIDTDDYNEQGRFVGALAEFADESQGHVHVVAHPRKQTSEEYPPGKMDVAGHANLTNRAFNGLTVFRNKAKIEQLKDAFDSKDANLIRQAQAEHDAELICWKQRETGEEFHIRLWMHRESLQFWPHVSPVGRRYLNSKAA